LREALEPEKGERLVNEYEIAAQEVLPYLRDHLGWPNELISAYGRVPVQIGGSTVWADFVCYISRAQRPLPWLVVEVKQPGPPLKEAIPQAESYSLILAAPFFCVTDGNDFRFYATGHAQGQSICLQSLPPNPFPEYLSPLVEWIVFPPSVDYLANLFLVGLEREERFRRDTEWHDEASKELHEQVFERIDALSPQGLKGTLDHCLMMKPPNRNELFRQIDEDFGKFKRVLKFIRDFAGDPIINLNRLIDPKQSLHLKGGGIFFVTQLLAGAHLDEYVVLEENASRALRQLGVTDILVKNDTANGYVYVNEICKKLFKDKLEQRLKDHGFEFGLAAVHNFLWHYYVHYRTARKWHP